MPIVVAFLLQSWLPVCRTEHWILIKTGDHGTGSGDKNIITMLLIFLAAGSFVGVVEEAVLKCYIVCWSLDTCQIFSICAVYSCLFVSVAMGTSVGTITLLTPIAAAVSWYIRI